MIPANKYGQAEEAQEALELTEEEVKMADTIKVKNFSQLETWRKHSVQCHISEMSLEALIHQWTIYVTCQRSLITNYIETEQ